MVAKGPRRDRDDGISHGRFAVPARGANLCNQISVWGGHGETSPPVAVERSYERFTAEIGFGPGAGRWHNCFCFAENSLRPLLCYEQLRSVCVSELVEL